MQNHLKNDPCFLKIQTNASNHIGFFFFLNESHIKEESDFQGKLWIRNLETESNNSSD